jgi:hypothetical protein
LHTGAVAADEPADEGSEIKNAFAAEVPRDRRCGASAIQPRSLSDFDLRDALQGDK